MKTSVIEVHDMLSVLSVLGVEKRIGEVPGVESVTVNYAAGSATVRYDETRLEVADIKSAVRQSAYESEGKSLPKHFSKDKPAHKRAGVPTPEEVPASASTPDATEPKAASGAPAASAIDSHKGHPAPGAQSAAPAAESPKAPTGASASVRAPAALAADGNKSQSAGGAQPSTPVAAVPKAPPDSTVAVAAPAAPATGGHEGHAAPAAPECWLNAGMRSSP